MDKVMLTSSDKVIIVAYHLPLRVAQLHVASARSRAVGLARQQQSGPSRSQLYADNYGRRRQPRTLDAY